MQEIEPTHPVHPHHPKHPDNDHFRRHHPHAQNVQGILAVFVVAVIAVAILVGISTNAPFGSVILSFLPSLAFAFAGAALLQSDHFDLRYLASALLGILIILGIVLSLLIPGSDILAIVGINLFLGVLLLIVLHSSPIPHEDSAAVVLPIEATELSELFDEIKEKCKTINIAIGRVYRKGEGGSPVLRKRLHIPNELYNELDMDKRPEVLVDVLEKIKIQLDDLLKNERDLFTKSELDKLMVEFRSDSGRTQILQVIADNQGDHVKEAHAALYEFTNVAIEKLRPQ